MWGRAGAACVLAGVEFRDYVPVGPVTLAESGHGQLAFALRRCRFTIGMRGNRFPGGALMCHPHLTFPDAMQLATRRAVLFGAFLVPALLAAPAQAQYFRASL